MLFILGNLLELSKTCSGGIDIVSGSLQIAINSGNNLLMAGTDTVTLTSSAGLIQIVSDDDVILPGDSNRINDGNFTIRVQNYSATPTSTPVNIHFVVIKTQ